jgi:hypothetical protein
MIADRGDTSCCDETMLFASSFCLCGNGGEGFHFGRRSIEHRDNPAAFIFYAVAVAQNRRQKPVRGATQTSPCYRRFRLGLMAGIKSFAQTPGASVCLAG